jgi:hypothetical protein
VPKYQVLVRFQRAVAGIGHVVGPDVKGMYRWETRSFEEMQAVIALLWRFLGLVKRRQAAGALREIVDQYRSGRIKARPSRPRSSRPRLDRTSISVVWTTDELERAWAAGLIYAEGCFGVVHGRSRKRGPAWYRIRASAAQNGQVGKPAEVLCRLQASLGGVGRTERHGDPDDYRWLVEGEQRIEAVVDRVRPWLGQKKVDQAELAIHRFRAQTRQHGTATHCVRGHAYGGSSMRGGRLRRFCRPCDRINSRRRRAAHGISRQFKDPTRRYTF